MPQNGIVFEIKEMAVFDGPGIRTTVFLKGCPLRCVWCHNPEGLSPNRQMMAAANGCAHCGRCEAACPRNLDRGACTLCGACVTACPNRLRKICGTEYSPDALAQLLLKNKDYLARQGGGVTFSGGEPTMQADFLLSTLQKINGMHRAIETCGYCAPEEFARILSHVELVLFDLKLANADQHRQYTGKDNALILENLETLRNSGLPFIVRIPLIPGVNDSAENMRASAELLQNTPSLQAVELLPYHKTAGAKYTMVGREYTPSFDVRQAVRIMPEIFAEYGISCRAL